MSIIVALSYFIFLYPLYMSFVWMIGGLIFSIRREYFQVIHLDYHPFFSVILPAYNEEKVIEVILENLKDLNYPAYEVIVVNDGSTDKTAELLDRLVLKHPSWLRAVHLQENRGKANALNMGIMVSKGQFLLTIDADCLLDKEALRWFAWHLLNFPRVGAVTGNPRVWNRTTLLAKIQVGEYSNIIGLIKRTQRIVGKILTVSGVIAAYRKSALLDCGFFDADTVTEDIDITWKLQKKFWDVRYEPRALCWILVPETIKGLWRQRVRWAYGGLQVLIKHIGIWLDFRYRRFWPIYVEYALGMIWALLLFIVTVSWIILTLIKTTCGSYFVAKYCVPVYAIGEAVPIFSNPLYPKWYGAVLCLACLGEFFVSFVIDRKYEKHFLRSYFWVIWYPLVYWIIITLSLLQNSQKLQLHEANGDVWES